MADEYSCKYVLMFSVSNACFNKICGNPIAVSARWLANEVIV